ncbi:hypothetical protein DFH07DRAFT_965773 [Mycena maculata]|uniref:Uncharacterized protein n=1 Tax=Mycena maculata TaxID=230809 RepID=A0AAD7MZH4_9AGAR|nr:hypothetical protein DFH07DRAFT_965773 [Mycena maculata]
MATPYMTELTNRRNAKRGNAPSIYDGCMKALEKMGAHSLAGHEFDVTFGRSGEDNDKNRTIFFDYVNLANSKVFSANIVAEIGSQDEGTWLAAYPKKIFDSKLPLNDESSAQRMVIAARCPTGAPPSLAKIWRSSMNAAEGVRFKDIETENEEFEVTDWVSRSDGADDKPYDIMLLRLLPTYEAPKLHGKSGGSSPRKVRPRNKDDDTLSEDVNMDTPLNKIPSPKERKIGDTYNPDCLPDHRGPYFAHRESKLVQRDYRDLDGDLIAPYELYEKLTEGTLFSAQISMHTYIFPGKRGNTRSKIYHIYIDKLRIHDKGFGEAWHPPIPSLPSADPSSPRKRARAERDDEADKSFDFFNSVSPVKRARITKT